MNLSKITFTLLTSLFSMQLFAASFTVDTTTDAIDNNIGDSICATAANECSLRAAIQELNTMAGSHTVSLPAGGSPAIDSADNSTCPVDDQRGVTRPFDGDADSIAVCDRGSVEVNDACPSDSAKTLPGICGCGVADTDDNSNSVTDCLANDDLLKQLVKLRKKLSKLTTLTSDDQLKKVYKLSKQAVAFVQTWESNIVLSGGVDPVKGIKKVNKTIKQALTSSAADFAANQDQAIEIVTKLGKLL